MSEKKGFQFFDYVDFLVSRKEILAVVFVASFVLCFALVYFFVEEEFEASAVLVPRPEDATPTASALLRNIKNLPLGLGAKAGRSDIDLYVTVISSRVFLEEVIHRFDLYTVYEVDSTSAKGRELAVWRLGREIFGHETEESAFKLTVKSTKPELAADMANFIVKRMSERIIELNTGRSRQNKEFLAQRIADLGARRKIAEDSLQAYQERTGLLDAKVQLQGIISANTSLETDLAARRVQRDILERMYDAESPQVKEVEMQIQVYEKRLNDMRSRREAGSPLVPLNKLPATAVEFLRRYREVELTNLLIEYVTPIYEQARIDEKKDYPVVQVIDYAVPPAKKSYPPRTAYAFLGAIAVTLAVFTLLLLRAVLALDTESHWHTVIERGKRWTWKALKRQP
jgi:tyrosine-protein kinase Etk/Wzc